MTNEHETRQHQLMEILSQARLPTRGDELAKRLGVTRQVVVHDIALLRSVRFYLNDRVFVACRLLAVVFHLCTILTTVLNLHHMRRKANAVRSRLLYVHMLAHLSNLD